MKFNDNGYLDPGLHPATISDIEMYLVTPFQAPSTRPKVFEGYQRHATELETFSMSFSQFLDGSFVSTKHDPGDVDLLGMADQATVDALSATEKRRLRALFLGEENKRDYDCHTFFLAVLPETDPAFESYRSLRKYWLGEFGFDRRDVPKGILTVIIASPGPPTAPPT